MSPAAATWPRAALGYCSNVHAGADPAAVARLLTGPIRAVRRARGLPRMATGLWLAADAARVFAADPARLADLLATAGLDLITLNGFPFADFHQPRVKEAVYRPAWDEPARLAYTLDLATVLARCLAPAAAFGSISTLPVGFAADFTAERAARARVQLCRLAEGLARLADRTGRGLRVCLEPEPDCVLETTAGAIVWFTEALPATARGLGIDPALLRDHLALCLDVCHLAVGFEAPATALAALAAAGVPVGKVQVSSALAITDPARADLEALLAPFAEPRYLHQVRCRRPDGTVVGRPDLPLALADPGFPRDGPWRVHYHVPLQWQAPTGGPGTTSASIGAVLAALTELPDPAPHLEVETYTWSVLPEALRPADEPALVRGLAEELAWLEAALGEGGLLQCPAPDHLP